MHLDKSWRISWILGLQERGTLSVVRLRCLSPKGCLVMLWYNSYHDASKPYCTQFAGQRPLLNNAWCHKPLLYSLCWSMTIVKAHLYSLCWSTKLPNNAVMLQSSVVLIVLVNEHYQTLLWYYKAHLYPLRKNAVILQSSVVLMVLVNKVATQCCNAAKLSCTHGACRQSYRAML